jgi:chorismate-pyruvate lyase
MGPSSLGQLDGQAPVRPSIGSRRGHAPRRDLVPDWAELPPTHANIDDLDPFARVLATTDGTVTEILEAWAGDHVSVGWVSQRRADLDRPVDALGAGPGTTVLRRDVLLIGTRTGRALLYAESLIAIDRLPTVVRDGLIAGTRPIGRLLRESRLETFREIRCLRREPAGQVARDFDARPDDPFVMRSYTIVAGGLPLMLIAEKFPGRARPDAAQPLARAM